MNTIRSNKKCLLCSFICNDIDGITRNDKRHCIFCEYSIKCNLCAICIKDAGPLCIEHLPRNDEGLTYYPPILLFEFNRWSCFADFRTNYIGKKKMY